MRVFFFPLIGLGCGGGSELPTGHVPALDEIEAKVEPVVSSDWLEAHFKTPVPAQGPAPETYSAIEASLDPAMCGACHPQQYADWSESWHALGMGPGLMGQLLDWDGSNDKMVAMCNRCHAPLAEQYPRLKVPDSDTYADNPDFSEKMRVAGLTCAGCHVREHRRYGPPAEGMEPSETERTEGPHGGFVVRSDYQSPSFCAPCHDFAPGSRTLEGKLIQETTEEWRRTSAAAEGQTCQSCHMPQGRHLWKGIHDPEMVLKGLTMAASLSDVGGLFAPVRASLTATNSGAGHRMPTYTTPEIHLIIEQFDEAGAVIEGSRRHTIIGRRLRPNLSEELFDTRLLQGESLTLPYVVRRHGGAAGIQARVEVWPDEAYRRFYEIKLRRPEKHPKGEALLREALQASIDSRYQVFEERISFGGGEAGN